MASLLPVLTTALVSTGVGLVQNEITRQSDRLERNQALDQLQQRQALEQRQSTQDAVLEQQKIAVEAHNAEEERKQALRRAVARQRANFGAQGISSGGGSAQAVLLGLFEESDDERGRREELDKIRKRSIDQDLSQKNSLNVLQRTQLQERNKLKTLSGFADSVGDALF